MNRREFFHRTMGAAVAPLVLEHFIPSSLLAGFFPMDDADETLCKQKFEFAIDQQLAERPINEVIAEGLAKRKEFAWAAWDSYRRFLQMYGMFQGLDRNFFDSIIDTYKYRYEVSRKIQFAPDQMKQIALAYKRAMHERGIEVPSRAGDQLQHAILQVFASWHSEQARIYRRQMHLSDEWGTAVIVQAMVFGNLNDQSGSGVIFTRNPKGPSQEVNLYGDFIFGVQGDDIVSGLVATYPISEK